MKVLLIGMLSLFSVTVLAGTIELSYCPKPNNGISKILGHELINRAVKKVEGKSSFIVCNQERYGNYLYDNASKETYEIEFSEECMQVVASIRSNLRDSFTFIVDDVTGLVLSIERDATVQCATLLKL